jgi:putative hydrolase of HD superfamily
MDSSRLQAQLRFVVEIDKLKRVLRRTTLMDATRNENSAEHSWHLAVMAVLLEEYVPERADLGRVVRMVLVHDIVEIDAGDTFCYDPEANLDKAERERLAAERIFGLLPSDQAHELKALWEEFEEARTADARFANALDRLQPLLHNLHTGGGTWRIHGVARDQVLARMQPIRLAMPALWPFVEESLARAADEGWVR